MAHILNIYLFIWIYFVFSGFCRVGTGIARLGVFAGGGESRGHKNQLQPTAWPTEDGTGGRFFFGSLSDIICLVPLYFCIWCSAY